MIGCPRNAASFGRSPVWLIGISRNAENGFEIGTANGTTGNLSGPELIARRTGENWLNGRALGLRGRLKRIRLGVYEFGYRPIGKNVAAKLESIMPKD